MPYTIGLDYGTNSVRCLVMDCISDNRTIRVYQQLCVLYKKLDNNFGIRGTMKIFQNVLTIKEKTNA